MLPGFNPHTIECTYVDNSSECNTQVQYPALEEPTSQCILALDCESLEAKGICESAAMLLPRQEQSQSSGGLVTTGGSKGICQ